MVNNTDYLRLLITDTEPDENGKYLFDDDDLEIFLNNTRNVYFAAAFALRTIAANEVLLTTYLRTDDLTVDGSVVAKELRLLALDYENQGKSEDNTSGDNYGIAINFPEPRFDGDCLNKPEGVNSWFL